MTYVSGEPHIIATLINITAACEILKVLPESDLVIQAQEVLTMAVELLIDYSEDQQISESDLCDIMRGADEIKREARRIYATVKR